MGVVTFGTLVGALLPFLLKRLGLDPATSSAPFVATLVDVTGLVIARGKRVIAPCDLENALRRGTSHGES